MSGLEVLTEIVFPIIIGAGILLCLLRMLGGPTTVDRAVAVDTTLVLLGFVFQRYVYLDVALVYAVLTFIGAVAIARYLEGGL